MLVDETPECSSCSITLYTAPFLLLYIHLNREYYFKRVDIMMNLENLIYTWPSYRQFCDYLFGRS